MPYILTGGKSSRFGADKATWEHRGRPLALWVADALRPRFGEPRLVASTAPGLVSGLGLEVIVDRFPGQGPAAGLHAALRDTQAAAEVVVGCDMPWLDAALLERQMHALLATPGALACAPRLDGRWEPLHGVYRREAADILAELLEAGQRRMQAIFDALAPIDATTTMKADLSRWQRSTRSANTPDLLEDDPSSRA